MNIEKIIRENIDNVLHMSLATAENNKPWSSEVHFVYDPDLNLYFRSTKARCHSQEIAKNPYVSGTIVKQYELGEPCVGIYFEGIASLIEDYEYMDNVVDLFETRQKAKNALDEAKKDGGHKIYKITVKNWYIFGNFDGQSTKKYILEWSEK